MRVGTGNEAGIATGASPAILLWLASVDELLAALSGHLQTACREFKLSISSERFSSEWWSRVSNESPNDTQFLLCSNCFFDEGLRIDSWKHGVEQQGECQSCKSSDGRKLTKDHILSIAHRFFVSGTTIRFDYGAAPGVQCNEHHYGKTSITPSPWLENDVKLIEDAAKIGFFPYGPRFWMFGEVEPLKALQDSASRPQIIERVLREYPERTLSEGDTFYRIRVNPERPADPDEYDSAPLHLAGKGRLDSAGLAVMYGSQEIDVCIHECRASADDDMYVATLRSRRQLRLLNLAAVLKEDVTEFESLDMAIHMLFLAKSHSYEISRAIAVAASGAGFDGVIYPSYFSLLRTGGRPFETTYGLSLRRFHPQAEQYAAAYMIPNFALFGRPIKEGSVYVKCINRMILTQVGYRGHFGPVAY